MNRLCTTHVPYLIFSSKRGKILGNLNFGLPDIKMPRLRPLWVKIKNGSQIRKEHILFDLDPTCLVQKAFETASRGHFTKKKLSPSDADIVLMNVHYH